ncbi:SGNH/GDSL hydrolase family protein [Legionella sp. PATHC038]|uniref:SGNH/GDSL hydrolase family protein n=1 Tax=Legionella sheltonii TaxID=2992041 RepID=UPI002244D1E3|nr:SGNH/GDSL hydrolase family protein [Legionella sp. PATHC038]MCW8398649.1 SGNH/GDSL hydrolase family protein [Legionella sp. PATHC038]
MIKKTIILLVLLALSINSYSYKFDTITVFGDSLSDNGNLYTYMAHFIPKSPPYYQGRFSNGPVWVENLYQYYFPNGSSDNFQDFAVGGAGAVLSYKENLPYTLDAEINDYLYLHQYTNKDTTLYIVWIGSNNYLNGPTNVEDITSSVVDAIGTDIESLINNGAVMVLMVNIPDLGKTPEAAQNNNQALLSELTNKHNEKLLAKYNQLKERYPNVNIAYFDVYSLFNQLISEPNQFNVTNITQPCYSGGFSLRAMANNTELLDNYLKTQAKQHHLVLDEKKKQAILSNPVLKEALLVGYQEQTLRRLNANSNSCSGYLFWDHVHPTGPIHQLIAQFAKTIIDEAGFQAISQ